MFLKRKFHVLMAPAGDEGGGAAVVDRGDSWTPTEEDIEAAKALKADPLPENDPEVKKLDDEIESDKAPKTDKPAKDTRIPLSRHKDILERERAHREALEAELAKYRQGAQIADANVKISEVETQLLDMEKQYAKLLVDGETEKAVDLMSKIRRAERQINEQNATVREAAAEARAVERVRYDVTVERLEEQYSELNVDSPDFDKAKVAEIMELKDAYQSKGYTPSAALQKAVKLIMPPQTRAQERATEVEARVTAADVAAARKAEAAGKTAEAVGKTPPNAAKVGTDSDKMGGGPITAKDVMKMDQAAFAKLNEETLARLRGDTL